MDTKVTPTELDFACQALREAKEAEDVAKQRRIQAEERVIELAGLNESGEGSHSEKTNFFKVTTTAKITRSLNKARVGEINIDPAISPFKPDWRLDLKQLRAIEQVDGDLELALQVNGDYIDLEVRSFTGLVRPDLEGPAQFKPEAHVDAGGEKIPELAYPLVRALE